MEHDTPAISVERLSKSFGDLKAVDDLSFTVPKGKCTAFLGPNGAGKTTTIKTLYGKARYDACPETKVTVLGFDLPRRELDVKCRMGLVPQDNSLDDQLNVEQNLFVFSKLYGMPSRTAKTRIKELLVFMELEDKAKSRVRELSGGMKRRLVIARALLNAPELLILDEPTTGLDPQVRQHIWDKLRALMRQGVTILLTTHYMDEAWQIADEIIIMDKGKKILQGNPRALLEERMEKFVLEIHDNGDEAVEDARKLIADLEKAGRVRVERPEPRVIVYSRDESALDGIAALLPQRTHLKRHTHLEDLFLAVTGRSIDE